MFARCLPRTPEFADLSKGVSGLELADSITGDAHKMLNVVRLTTLNKATPLPHD
jgi:glutamate/tyrosine decarboxylase-like PLP-dependent enzyme